MQLGLNSEPRATLVDRFTDVTKLLHEINDQIVFTVDRDELGSALCDAVQVSHLLQSVAAKLGLAATNNAVIAQAGQRTTGQFVAARTNGRGRDINRLTNTAKWLRDFPIFESAFGFELTADHVDYLRKTLDTNFDTRRELTDSQQFFVDTARRCSFAGFVQACDYWLTYVDPDGKEPKDQLERSRLRIGTGRGGRGEIEGTCDAVTAQIIKTAVDHEAAKLRRADQADDVDRTDAQRRMVALANLVQRGFARDDGTFPAPLVNIVMSLKVAEWAQAVLAGKIEPGDVVPVDAHDIDGRCELIDGTPIHPFLAVAAMGNYGFDSAGQPNLRRYVLTADSRPLDVSVNARSFPEWMRTTALIGTRGQCGTFGCESPHSWLQIDHVQPVVHGGETRLDNGEPSCSPDNLSKGADQGRKAWRDRTPPPRRTPLHRPKPRGTTSSSDDDPDDQPSF